MVFNILVGENRVFNPRFLCQKPSLTLHPPIYDIFIYPIPLYLMTKGIKILC